MIVSATVFVVEKHATEVIPKVIRKVNGIICRLPYYSIYVFKLQESFSQDV
jgi:hypothetical protein